MQSKKKVNTMKMNWRPKLFRKSATCTRCERISPKIIYKKCKIMFKCSSSYNKSDCKKNIPRTMRRAHFKSNSFCRKYLKKYKNCNIWMTSCTQKQKLLISICKICMILNTLKTLWIKSNF